MCEIGSLPARSGGLECMIKKELWKIIYMNLNIIIQSNRENIMMNMAGSSGLHLLSGYFGGRILEWCELIPVAGNSTSVSG